MVKYLLIHKLSSCSMENGGGCCGDDDVGDDSTVIGSVALLPTHHLVYLLQS